MIINKKLLAVESYDNGGITDYDGYIKLDANESFIDLPKEKKRLLKNAIDDVNFARYPDMMAAKTAKAFGNFLGVEDKYITVGNGSDELISVIINGFCEKDDMVLVLSPDFSMYKFYSYIAEVSCLSIPKDKDFKPDIDMLVQIISNKKPRIVIFSNPCNPTGQEISREDVARIIKATDGLAIIDEAYMDFGNESIIPSFKEFDNLVVLKTASKAFGLAALRLGIAISKEEITGKLRAVKSPYNVNAISNLFGSIVIEDNDYLKTCIDTIKKSKQELFSKIKALGFDVLETATNFVVLRDNNADEIYDFLLQKKILVRNFNWFLRITAGNKSENKAVLEALKEYKLSLEKGELQDEKSYN
ncbi:MAG: histidinol-phosphate transaminase [Clostridia bacterium]